MISIKKVLFYTIRIRKVLLCNNIMCAAANHIPHLSDLIFTNVTIKCPKYVAAYCFYVMFQFNSKP